MAGREGRPDPKEAALAATRCLNPHPEQVRDPGFLASEFFDARDMVQVKYEMVRKVRADGAPVTAAAAATSVHPAGRENSRPFSSCRWTRSSPQFWRYATNSKSRPASGWNGCVTRTRRYRSCGSGVVDDAGQ